MENDELQIPRCANCQRWAHPASDRCPTCDGELARQPASGNGTVYTYTVNEHQYHPDFPPPYVIALVELDERPGLRLVTNITGCEPAAVSIGMPVRSANGAFVPRLPPLSGAI